MGNSEKERMQTLSFRDDQRNSKNMKTQVIENT